MTGRALALAGLLLALGCAHGGEPDLSQIASNSDQVIWEAGQQALERKQYETARQYLRRIVDGFPNSQYGPAARLAIGDSHFEEGGTANYMLAVAAYREFLTVFPSHPRSDYAQFRAAEAYFKQKNSPDRDQTQTRQALQEYERLLDVYPQSEYAEQARGRIRELRGSLARAEFLAGYFYQRTRDACRSAVQRYEGILAHYPEYEGLDEVLFRLGECLYAMGRPAEAPVHLNRVLSEYPQSDYADEVRELLGKIAESAPVTAPPPAATPTAEGTIAPAPGAPPRESAPTTTPDPAPSPSLEPRP